MSDCLTVMRDLFLLDPREDMITPLRSKMMAPNGGILGMMPACIHPYNAMGIKIISVYQQNYLKGLSSHQGIIHLFDAETGTPQLSLDADEVTAIRTAAVSALMTDVLAVEEAETLCLIGSGTQAVSHLEAIALVRPIKRVKVWSPNPENVQKFVQSQRRIYDFTIEACPNAEAATRHADIVCTLTSSPDPVVFNDWLKPDAHINAVGVSAPRFSELAADVVLDSDIFVDNYESACHEAGDLILALGEENVRTAIKADIHEALTQPALVEKKRKTLFKSVGLGVEDVAVAHFCFQKIMGADGKP